MQVAKRKASAGPLGKRRKLAVVVSDNGRRWAVGERVTVQMGPERIHAVVVEDRGDLGPNHSQVVRVEPEAEPAGGAEQFEVPAAALRLRLKAPGVGHGRSARLKVAREQARASARTWVLYEFDAEDDLLKESSYADQASLLRALEQRGLERDSQRALLEGKEIFVHA
jgi:hypothetical protein